MNRPPVTFAVEDVRHLIDQVLPMARELASLNPLPALTPTPELLIERQAAGYVLHTMRHQGALSGVCWAHVLPRGGALDAGMVIAKPYRGGMAALDFSRFVERSMRERGATWMVWECHERSAALARRRGLRPMSQRFLADLTKAAP